MEFKVCSGNYINIYEANGKCDIILLINEPNRIPTIKELISLQNIIRELIQIHMESKECNAGKVQTEIERIVDSCQFDCLKYGFQIFITKWEN